MSLPAQHEPVAPAPSGPGPRTLTQRAIRGSIWTVGTYATNQVLRLGSNLVLSRLLFPEAFGLMAAVWVFIQGLQMFSDLGIGPSIVQSKRGDDPKFLNTAWTIQVMRGFGLWAASVAVAWPAAWYFDPQLRWLIPVVGSTAAIAGFNSVSAFIVGRRLALGRVSAITLASLLTSILVTLAWAWCSPTVWSLVAGTIAGSLMHLVLSHTLLPRWRHRFCWDAESRQALFHFGRWVFLNTLVGFIGNQIDRLILLKLMGTAFLGVYYMAMTLAYVPWQVGMAVSGAVLFPALSECMRRGDADLGAKLRKARSAVLPVCLAVSLGILLLAPAFFELLYDRRYHDAGWIGQYGAVVTWLALLRATSDRALLAMGDSRSVAVSNIFRLATTVGGSLAGYRYLGMEGFLWGTVAGTAVGTAIVDVMLKRRGMSVMAQDVRYTSLFLGLGGLGLVGARLVGRLPSGGDVYATAWSAVIVAAVCAWAVHLTLRTVRRRHSVAPAATGGAFGVQASPASS